MDTPDGDEMPDHPCENPKGSQPTAESAEAAGAAPAPRARQREGDSLQMTKQAQVTQRPTQRFFRGTEARSSSRSGQVLLGDLGSPTHPEGLDVQSDNLLDGILEAGPQR